MGLLGDFIIYFADNVLVMCIACAACSLGGSLIPSLADDPILQQICGLVLTWLFMLVCWVICKKKLAEISRENAKSDGLLAVSDKASMWNHILAIAPWIGRVGAINLFITLGVEIDKYTAKNEYLGHRFAIYFTIFSIMFGLVWMMGHAFAEFERRGVDLLSLPVFCLDAINGSLLSCSGKALHFVVHVLVAGVVGKDDANEMTSRVGIEIVIGVLCIFFLGYCLPRFVLKTENDKTSHTLLAYLVIYVWAFSLVDFLWWYFYTILGSQLMFWGFTALLLVAAVVLAAASEGNFSGGPGVWSQTFGNMLCWTIDFAVWWGWGQVMTNTDAWVKAQEWYFRGATGLTNAVITFVLIAITGLLYTSSNHEDMLKHDFARANPVGCLDVRPWRNDSDPSRQSDDAESKSSDDSE